MSASREKKNRQALNKDGYVDPKVLREQERIASDRRAKLIYRSVAIIFVLVAALLLVWNSGVIQRNASAVTIDGKEYKTTDVAYYYRTIYSSFISENSSSLSTIGLDTSADLRDQACTLEGESGSWHDYFVKQATASMSSIVKLADAATAAGFDAAETVDEAEQNALENLDLYASLYGYNSRTQYIKAAFGSYMTEEDYVRNIRLSALANAYINDFKSTLSPTEEEIEAAYAADPKKYENTDIEYILFTTGLSSDASDEEKKAALEETEAKAQQALSRYQAGESLEAIGEDMDGVYTHLPYSSYSESSEMSVWAFDEERTAGDTAVIAYNSGNGHMAVLFNRHTRKDYHTVTVRDVLASDQATAEAVLADFLSGDTSETSFSMLPSTFSTSSGDEEEEQVSNGLTTTLYTDLDYGDMPEAFENWAYDPAREPGDTGIVETDYGFHVMYFVETNELPYWQLLITTELNQAAYDEWYSEIVGEPVIEQLNGMKYIG